MVSRAVLLKVSYIARRLGRSDETVYRWIREGQLRAINTNPNGSAVTGYPRYRVDRDDLLAFLQGPLGMPAETIRRLFA